VIDYFSTLIKNSLSGGSKQSLTYCFDPIGFVESPFKDKYGVPRQPQLASSAKGKIKFRNDPDLVTALKTLEQFSHLWVIFVFHDHGGKNWKPSIRPPRLGGRTKVGVLSSRSPHRPNPIGISPVKIESLNIEADGGAEILISGLDLIDGTPVLDIKPYIPYADSIPSAHAGWAADDIKKYPVSFSDEAKSFLLSLNEQYDEFLNLMIQVLEIDPRPAYQKRGAPIDQSGSEEQTYGIEISGFEVKYSIKEGGILVTKIYRPSGTK
jgi:tRNA-Thr(GGU) m(6)t(6)A37 methyltransferase TsaA